MTNNQEHGDFMKFSDLVGKKIITAILMKKAAFDDEGWLRLTFEDGTNCILVAGYGEYTGESEYEYPSYIYITEKVDDELIPV